MISVLSMEGKNERTGQKGRNNGATTGLKTQASGYVSEKEKIKAFTCYGYNSQLIPSVR